MSEGEKENREGEKGWEIERKRGPHGRREGRLNHLQAVRTPLAGPVLAAPALGPFQSPPSADGRFFGSPGGHAFEAGAPLPEACVQPRPGRCQARRVTVKHLHRPTESDGRGQRDSERGGGLVRRAAAWISAIKVTWEARMLHWRHGRTGERAGDVRTRRLQVALAITMRSRASRPCPAAAPAPTPCVRERDGGERWCSAGVVSGQGAT